MQSELKKEHHYNIITPWLIQEEDNFGKME
jgi:hypothetical protein